jgi:hypothetical protein
MRSQVTWANSSISSEYLTFGNRFVQLIIVEIRRKLCGATVSSGSKEIGTNQKNCVALVRKRTILTEPPPHIGEVSAKFCG